jgi:hypothetical protein
MKPCINSIWYNDNQFYTNIENNVGITDTKELDKVCVSNHNKGKCDIYTCEKREVLFQLLSHNAPQTR